MVKISEIEVGTVLRYEYGPVSRENIKLYANASGDMNNVHIDDAFAEQMGLKGVIAHGLYSFGMAARCVGEVGEVVKISGQMRAMVRPGDYYLVKLTVTAINNDLVEFEILQEAKTPIRIEKDGVIVKTYEAHEREWVSEKDIAKGLIKTEEVAEGTLYFRLQKSIPGAAIVRMKNGN